MWPCFIFFETIRLICPFNGKKEILMKEMAQKLAQKKHIIFNGRSISIKTLHKGGFEKQCDYTIPFFPFLLFLLVFFYILFVVTICEDLNTQQILDGYCSGNELKFFWLLTSFARSRSVFLELTLTVFLLDFLWSKVLSLFYVDNWMIFDAWWKFCAGIVSFCCNS